MTKSERHEAIRARCSRAIADIYHNATPRYPRLDGDDAERFDAWWEFTRDSEIDYLNGGGAYAPTEVKYRAILERNAGRYTSFAARARYIARGMAQMREERAGVAAWERINEWGALYQWGRGGRTLAPSDLVRDGGGGFSLKVHEYNSVDDYSIATVTDALRVFESFNAYVRDWCAGVAVMWEESERERKAQEEVDAAEAEEAQRREWERREREMDQHYGGL